MKRLTVALALTLSLTLPGTASAHRQTCNQHVHPQIGRLTRLGFKCVQGANWVNVSATSAVTVRDAGIKTCGWCDIPNWVTLGLLVR